MGQKTVTSADAVRFRRRLLAWFAANGRTLPWRGADVPPWGVMVSEFMLQQTQVERVIPRYLAFMRRWPAPSALARAPQAAVIAAWSGLGYNRRAKHLRDAAAAIATLHGGEVPSDPEALAALPGVGPYTAGAVAAFAFNRDVVLWDTNVRRIALRAFFGGEFADRDVPDAGLRLVLERVLPKGQARDWYGALMDLGSEVCRGRGPACGACPLRRSCAASARFLAGAEPGRRLVRPQTRFEGSRRQERGALLKAVAGVRAGVSVPSMEKEFGRPLRTAARELIREGLLAGDPDGKVRLA